VPAGTIPIEHSFISGEDTWDVVITLSSLLVYTYWNLFVVPFLMTPEMDTWDIARSRKFAQVPSDVIVLVQCVKMRSTVRNDQLLKK
jgi:hypothetical protein